MQLQGGKPIGLWRSTQINVQYSPSLKRKHPSNMTIYIGNAGLKSEIFYLKKQNKNNLKI
jgi:hypothetical protein